MDEAIAYTSNVHASIGYDPKSSDPVDYTSFILGLRGLEQLPPPAPVLSPELDVLTACYNLLTRRNLQSCYDLLKCAVISILTTAFLPFLYAHQEFKA